MIKAIILAFVAGCENSAAELTFALSYSNAAQASRYTHLPKLFWFIRHRLSFADSFALPF